MALIRCGGKTNIELLAFETSNPTSSSTTLNVFTASATKKYLISAHASNSGSDGHASVVINVNGSPIITLNSTTSTPASNAMEITLNANDVVSMVTTLGSNASRAVGACAVFNI